MTTQTIDLTKNPELAALVADKEPGDWIELRASIKAKDEQTLTIRLEECDDAEKPESDDDDEDETETVPEKTTEAPAESRGKSLSRKLTSSYGE